ncbi:polyphosphate kinase 1 [Thermoleophilia bacterium SCSIO 60948]|nr:polyphosphate kinase 1 [Thermoleophilia bacterium SCSIO 60948]
MTSPEPAELSGPEAQAAAGDRDSDPNLEALSGVPERVPGLDEVPAPPPAQDFDDPALFFNRELSWLEFNARVLELAEDPDQPLLERLKFCAIWESNLDEFFMVRVATLNAARETGRGGRGADALGPGEQIELIADRVAEQRSRVCRAFERQIRPALAGHGLRIVDIEDVPSEERRKLNALFERQIYPALTPLVLGLGRPFPYISNLSLSLLVMLRDPKSEGEVLARVKVPLEIFGRFVEVGEGGRTLLPVEQLIAANLASLFPGMEVVDHALFRVTRDTDYDVSDEADDLLQAVEEELRRRRFGEVMRLEVSAGMAPVLRDRLIDALGIDEDELFFVEGMLDMTGLWEVHGVRGFRELRDPPYSGVTPPALIDEGKPADFFAAMRERDIVVHHPYDSFATTVERFVEQAVHDPQVLAIKQTVYRTSADSPQIPMLIEAAERGKQVVCMVELKARFDESANIRWAKELEESGVHVVYGIPALKTHCKCVLVVRREGKGVRHYVHIGTGNYNAKTARIYTDIGLFTADRAIGLDIGEMFNYLTGYARTTRYRKALVAPFGLQPGIEAEIERTAAAHRPDAPARIRLKMNSLLDPASIRALYRASRAGVEIDLNVRGICALRPGVKGVSENINVKSIVGRFLEHSRIFSFERPGEEPAIYIGSADLMPRNLYNRVELVVPVLDASVREQLSDVLDRSLADDANSWVLDSTGKWTRSVPDGDRPRSVQRELMERHSMRSAEHATI